MLVATVTRKFVTLGLWYLSLVVEMADDRKILCLFDVDGTLTPSRKVRKRASMLLLWPSGPAAPGHHSGNEGVYTEYQKEGGHWDSRWIRL